MGAYHLSTPAPAFEVIEQMSERRVGDSWKREDLCGWEGGWRERRGLYERWICDIERMKTAERREMGKRMSGKGRRRPTSNVFRTFLLVKILGFGHRECLCLVGGWMGGCCFVGHCTLRVC